MIASYVKIKNLEEISDHANSNIPCGSSEFNLCLAFEIETIDLNRSCLSDVFETAQKWAADECPEDLHFNHGSFINGGMDHIIQELKNKPTSNRALYSLISQEHISDTGDRPIPSFMVLQTSIEDRVLYCTTYFRAIEISVFLRINLEEIRQRIEELINAGLGFDSVKLVINSFRAYSNTSSSPLSKPEFDLLTDIQIYKTLKENPYRIADLLRGKSKQSTVIYTKSISALREALDDKIDDCNFSQERVVDLLNQAICKSNHLLNMRKKHSHHNLISDSAGELSAIPDDHQL